MRVQTGVRGRRAVGLAVAVAGFLCTFGASGAGAATFNVESTAEFVAAVGKANAHAEANTIVVKKGSYLPGATLTFANTGGVQTIEGPAGSPTVEGAAAGLEGSSVEPFPSELFVVKKGVSVTFKNVEISHAGGAGAPVIKDSGVLDIESSAVLGNVGNSITVESGGTATVRNSTVANGLGFGLINDGGATTSFFNSTVAFNENGGVENKGTESLTNTIVAENTGAGDCVGKATTSDHSLDSDGSCGVGALSKMNPLLAPLANDGGTTLISSLKKGSPAIGAGDEATCTKEDQRGAKRAKACSIGADEYSSQAPTITTPSEVNAKATEASGEVVSYTAEAVGFEDVAAITCSPESGSVFPVGTTKVTCNAEDGHGNKATKSFNVNVSVVVAPTAVTKAASAVTQTGATLNATVNPNGAAVTECKFEYATAAIFELTDTYDETAPCSALPGSGSSAVAVSAAVTALSANTTYHFRIVAANAGAKGEGADETFKTPVEVVVAPAAVTKAASAVTQTGATLNATVNPNGVAVTSCTFEYGTSTAYDKTASCSALPGSGSSAVAVSAAVTALSANTTYHFRIVAANAGAGSQAVGSDETFKTPAALTGPAAEIRALLHEVSTSGIPHRISRDLSSLLANALHGLGRGGGLLSGYGGNAQVAAGEQSLQALTAPLDALISKPRGCASQPSLDELGRFIAVIENDQKGRRRQIPSGLASAWIRSAESIERSLSCRSKGHGRSGRSVSR
jgi:hypothetical protein